MTQKGFAPILIVLLIAVVGIGGYLIYTNYSNDRSNQTKSSPTPVVTTQTPQSTPSTTPADETANWKTYTNTKLKLEFKYPTSWIIKDLQKPSEEIDEKIESKGSEGDIDIVAWNEAYGGGCDTKDHIDFKIFGETQDICHNINNGIEFWNGMTKKLPTGYLMSIDSQANSPYQKNRDVVLKILSTFKSTQ